MSALRSTCRVFRAHQRRFVWREAERDPFQCALTAPDPPFAVFYVCGPWGTGKTT